MTLENETLRWALAYRWFARVFETPPRVAALEAYRSDEGTALLDNLSTIPGLAEAVSAIQALSAPGVDLGHAAETADAAFTKVFIINGARGASPYASVWLSERRLLCQEPARAMAKLMQEADLSIQKDVRELPDHIAIQLSFMAELLTRVAEGGVPAILPETFLDDHMLNWVPKFADRIQTLQHPGPYAAFARSLVMFLEADKQRYALQSDQDIGTANGNDETNPLRQSEIRA